MDQKTIVINGEIFRLVKMGNSGRPPIQYSQEFFSTLLSQRDTMTVRKLAEMYNVSSPTINRWLKKAKETLYAKEEA